MTQPPCKDRDSDLVLDPIIRHTARWLNAFGGFRPDELPDLVQELWTHYLAKRHLYDPTKGSRYVFCKAIVGKKAISLVRQRRAQKRDPFAEEYSVNGVVLDGDGFGTSVHETIPSCEPNRIRLDELDDDLIKLFECTGDKDRKVLAGKYAGLTHKQIQQDLCLPRRAFDAAWGRICTTAKELELDDYLADRRTASCRNRVHEQ
jgi:hypothetical protein